MVRALLAATLALSLWITPPATAKDMGGRLGIGGEAALSGPTIASGGLALRFWLDEVWGFHTALSLRDDADTDGKTTLGVTVRAQLNMARTDATNLYAAAGVTFRVVNNETQVLDFLLGVEHFFGDYFSVGGHVGFHVGLAGNNSFTLGNATSWGSTFLFYF